MGPELIVPLLIGSTALNVVGMISSGAAQRNAAEFNARQAELEGAHARQVAAVEESESRREARRFLGLQEAAFGASGIDLSGSALEVLAESAETAELDAITIRNAGSVEAAQRAAEAASQRYRGKAAFSAGVIGAGAAALRGVGGALYTQEQLRLTTGGS